MELKELTRKQIEEMCWELILNGIESGRKL